MKKLYIDSLSIYRNLIHDNTISTLRRLLDLLEKPTPDISTAVSLYSTIYNSLLKKNMNFKEFILNRVLFDDNPFTQMAERGSAAESIMKAAASDIQNLYSLMCLESGNLKEMILNKENLDEGEDLIVINLPPWENIKSCKFSNRGMDTINCLLELKSGYDAVEKLMNFHRENGSGIFAKYDAFICKMENGKPVLQGIENPDPIKLSDLIGYKPQKEQVVENTQFFLNGSAANNILLYGDRGTGKSSTVKALVNEYASQGLRILEVPKHLLVKFPEITLMIRRSSMRFIVFVDDLAFEDNEENYTALKAALEGGIESKAPNVVIYATSNRKHLVKEKFSERKGLLSSNKDDEIRAADTVQEKLSLADRFGMTVVFSSPGKKEYLEIVKGILNNRKIHINEEILERQALQWELRYNGRSPRTARQFSDWICSKGI